MLRPPFLGTSLEVNGLSYGPVAGKGRAFTSCLRRTHQTIHLSATCLVGRWFRHPPLYYYPWHASKIVQPLANENHYTR